MDLVQWILGAILFLSSLGVVIAKRPVYAALSFLVTLVTLAILYLLLFAQFIAVMQVLVYAGAILVIFMFVIVLFQDAHVAIEHFKPRSASWLLIASAAGLIAALLFLGKQLIPLHQKENLPQDFGTVEALGNALYLDFFFPFEAVILLFLIAIIGALYIGKKAKPLEYK